MRGSAHFVAEKQEGSFGPLSAALRMTRFYFLLARANARIQCGRYDRVFRYCRSHEKKSARLKCESAAQLEIPMASQIVRYTWLAQI